MQTRNEIPRFSSFNNLETRIKELIDNTGGIIIENVFSYEDVISIRRDLIDLINKEREAGILLDTDGSLRPRGVINILAEPILKLKKLIELAEIVLGQYPVLSSFTANVVQPGAKGQGMHRDYPYFSIPEKTSISELPTLCVQGIIALDDFEKDNSPTLVIPGSHKENAWIPQEEFEKLATPVIMPRGAMLFGHGAIAHGVAPNKSNRERAAIILSFLPYWVRPFNDLISRTKPEVLSLPGMDSLLGIDFKNRIRKDLSKMGFGMAKPGQK